jgi:hypothetical protein
VRAAGRQAARPISARVAKARARSARHRR